MRVVLTRITENPILAIEEAAANCYDSLPSKEGKIMAHCAKSGHHSVLEFCDFTFHIEGVSRALTHQLVRHRIASYAQRSQRYCAEDGFAYVIPNSIKNNELALDQYIHYMDKISELYSNLVSMDNIPAEDARMVLPNACETVIEVKMNFRSLIHFMNERLCTRAQWEIRQMALLMKKAVEEQYPKLAEYLVPKCEIHKNNPFCTEVKSCGRHPLLKDIYAHFTNPKYAQFDEMIENVKLGIITDEELVDKFW